MIYVTVADSDAFSETFAKLHEDLRSAGSDGGPPQPLPSIDEMYMTLRKLPGVRKAVESEIKRNGVARVSQLRQERQRRRVILDNQLAHIRLRRDQMHIHAEEVKHAIDMQVAAMDHRVASLQAVALRRLQVLLFECLGEIQKAIARAQQRVETQETSVDLMTATCELNHAWAIFSKRCEEFFNITSVVDVPPKVLTTNATYVENPVFQSWVSALAPFLSKHLDLPLAPATLASPELSITRILAVKSSHASPSKWPSNAHNKTHIIVPRHRQPLDGPEPSDRMSTQYEALYDLLEIASARHLKRPKSKGKLKTVQPSLFPDGFTCTTPLSSSTIRWLPQVAHGALQVPTNGCIYYCLNDLQARPSDGCGNKTHVSLSLARIASPNLQQNAAVARTEALAARYVPSLSGTPADSAGPFQVDHVFPHDHVVRAIPLDAMGRRQSAPTTNGPDSVDEGVESLHFAPANVSHLIQSATFTDMAQMLAPESQMNLHLRYPPETFALHTLQHLYVAVPATRQSAPTSTPRGRPSTSASSRRNPLLESILYPISADAMRVLISTYVIRDPKVMADGGMASLFSLYRPSFGSDASYCVVENPGFLRPAPASVSSPSDDPSMLVVQYTTQAVPAPLQTSRPKAPPSSVLGTFCSWRSCLDEATVGTTRLCDSHARLEAMLTPEERVQVLGSASRQCPAATAMAPAMEIRQIKHSSSLLEELLNQQLRTTLETFLDKVAADGSNRALLADVAGAIAARIDSPGRDAATNEAFDEIEMLEQVLQVERAATDEVRMLVALGVYPTAELGLLRQKVNQTHTPLQASQRKLILLRTRRQEEEERQVKLKGKRPGLAASKSCPSVSKGHEQVSKAKKRRDSSKKYTE
ncbi:hypothetical protein H310_04463 [Aphanomyces invadans]|uniref:Uncharacterized protein n=1 Tax=Aphanomyces invadans TaxID=157072 RepID=A0A024UCV4_9STRA|nr:hypothetical protein H310_04463 [Aphanomyces invadans]ETW04099.1 hypothetical protein H310_04463 [Aphanomyces invadans]|eukprot:XP_008867055.1 hypothetical protein H310_04463 [Aphanomyces invadans]